MNYIKRDIESKILAVSKEYSCLLVTGPRQVEKTTVLRRLAKTDPALFLQMHTLPILIDEVQYAPALFSYIKIAVYNGATPGAFWLTGSQAFRLMELAQESLAGRIAILRMPALSQHEIYGKGECVSFSLELEDLKDGDRGGRATASAGDQAVDQPCRRTGGGV